MKKLLAALFVLASCQHQPAFADEITPITPINNRGVYYTFGKLSLLIPFNEVDVTYLYDVVGKRNLVGGETPIARIWDIQGTVGAVTSIDGHGAPYVGAKLALPNPVQNWAFLGKVQPGLFGGYDFTRGSAMGGFKADLPIFE